MEEFMLKMMAAMFYVIFGGAILVYILNTLCEGLDALINSTVEDWIGFTIFIVIIVVVAYFL